MGSCSGTYFALSAATGEVRWRYDTRTDDPDAAEFHGAPVVTEDLVVTPSDRSAAGLVYAFERQSGEVRWKRSFRGGVETDLLRSGALLIAQPAEGELIALDLPTGRTVWTMAPPVGARDRPRGRVSPALEDGRVFVGLPEGRVFAVDAATGKVLWERDLGVGLSSSLAADGGSVFLGTADRRLVRLDGRTGEVLARLEVETPAAWVPSPAGDTVLFILGEKTLAAASRDLEEIRWRRTTEGEWTTPRPLLWRGVAIVGNDKGELFALQPATGEISGAVTLHGQLRGLGSAGDVLYVGTLRGALHAWRPDRTWAAAGPPR